MTLPIGWQMYAMLPGRVTKQKCVNLEAELQAKISKEEMEERKE
jgi:hypothetical protein